MTFVQLFTNKNGTTMATDKKGISQVIENKNGTTTLIAPDGKITTIFGRYINGK